MITYIPFVPPPNTAPSPFGFASPLDSQIGNVLVPWNLFGRRWYFEMLGIGSVPIVLRALVGSPSGVLNKTITAYLEGFVIVETVVPHGYKLLDTVNLTIADALPEELNRVWSCYISSPTTYRFSYQFTPGAITDFGRTDYNINLAANYVSPSTVVFRESTQNFELTP